MYNYGYENNYENLYYNEYLKETNRQMDSAYFDYYTIEKGDNLYAIARKYNINPELLASMNGLSMQDYIYPGQQILIPKPGYSYYITASGDTLDMVADRFKIGKETLLRENPTIYLMEGQLLVTKRK